MWHAVLPRYSCCAEVEKGQLICCEVAVSLGNDENLGSGGRPAPSCATGFPGWGFDLLKVEMGRRRKIHSKT